MVESGLRQEAGELGAGELGDEPGNLPLGVAVSFASFSFAPVPLGGALDLREGMVAGVTGAGVLGTGAVVLSCLPYCSCCACMPLHRWVA